MRICIAIQEEVPRKPKGLAPHFLARLGQQKANGRITNT